MGMVLTSLAMEIPTKVNINEANLKDLGITNGTMAAFTLEISLMDSSKARASGKKATRLIRIIMKESITLIKSMVMEFLTGRAAICIKEIIMKMSVKGMEKCIG